VLGVLLAATLGGICAISDTGTGCSRYFVIGAITGALVGGVLGAMIGGNVWSDARDTSAAHPAVFASGLRRWSRVTVAFGRRSTDRRPGRPSLRTDTW
jgi:hypothetical protein